MPKSPQFRIQIRLGDWPRAGFPEKLRRRKLLHQLLTQARPGCGQLGIVSKSFQLYS
jgi:hypothetical protein